MVQTFADPGTISVPMSSILDALEGVLTEEERAKLFEELLGLRPAHVAPGDLITAELFNGVLSGINELMARVAVLEGAAGGPVIDHIEPPGDKPAASKITIVGKNLRPDDLATIVSFGNVDVADFFPESDETHLMVPVPVSLQNLPRDLPVTVTARGMTSNAVAIRVVPQIILASGTAHVTYLGAALAEIEIGETYTLGWRVLSQATVAQDFELSPTVVVKSGTATVNDWVAGINLPAGPIALEPGESLDIVMTVTIPANAGGADLGLYAESTAVAAIHGQGAPLSMVVGKEPEVSDPRSLVSAATFVSTTNLGKLVVSGEPSGFRVRPSVSVQLPLQVAVGGEGGGFYLFEAEAEPATGQAARWTIGPMSTARQQLGNSVTQPFEVPLTTSSTADLATISHIVVRAQCFATAAATTPVFTSFVRLPIAGKS